MFRLASVLLLLLLAHQFIAQAADAPFILPREEAPASCVDRRTLFNIICGCASTTLGRPYTQLEKDLSRQHSEDSN